MFKKLILIGLISGLSLPLVHAANYYKWVDSKGNVSYSSKPPPSGAKQQKIETIRSLGTAPAPQRAYAPKQTNSSTGNNQYQASSQPSYTQQRPSERSAEDEALRQKIIKDASTVQKGAKGLTANQRRTLAAMSGTDVPAENYSSNSSSVSTPARPAPAPSHVTSCDSSGCWDNQGNRYNGNNGTYFNNGRTCRDIGGQLQCN